MGVDYRNFLVPRDRNHDVATARIAELIARLRAERWVLQPGDPALEGAHDYAGIRAGAARERARLQDECGAAAPFIERRITRWKVPPLKNMMERRETAEPIPVPLDVTWIDAVRNRASPHPQAQELALRFTVSLPDDAFSTLGVPYPLAYGEDESGYHDYFVLASRDFVRHPAYGDVACACGADLAYTIPDDICAPIDFEGRVRAACARCNRPFDANGVSGGEVAFRFAVVVDCGKGWPLLRRLGEGPGLAAAIQAAGYEVGNPAKPRPRSPEDTPSSPGYDATVARSPYGDPAPPISDALLHLVEEVIGVPFDSIPEFF